MDAPVAAHGQTLAARQLVRACNRASLGTRLAGDGRAYVSLTATATDIDGSPLLLLSTLADHTRNLLADPAVSLLFEGTAGFANPQEGPRATVMGRIARAGETDLAQVRRRYLARHPGAALYADFKDFAFFRVTMERIHWVGGFARAAWLERHIVVDPRTAQRFIAAEPDLLKALQPSAAQIARSMLKHEGGAWTLTALDPDGGVLMQGNETHRFAFETPLDDPAQIAGALGLST
jgi:putative heme iron utilization protein